MGVIYINGENSIGILIIIIYIYTYIRRQNNAYINIMQ